MSGWGSSAAGGGPQEVPGPPPLALVPELEPLTSLQALMMACEGGHVAEIRRLLDEDPMLVHGRVGPLHNSPLHRAALHGRTKVVRTLLTGGAPLEAADRRGNTALALAVSCSKVETAEVLIARGADLTVRDRDGVTVMMKACRAGITGLLPSLLEPEGVLLDDVDRHGRTGLWYGARWGRVDVVRMLLERGADPLRADVQGKTPLMKAVINGCYEVVELLLSEAAGPAAVGINSVNSRGHTPCFYAAQMGHAALLDLLLRQGGDPSIADHGGVTPLMRGAWRGHGEVIRRLLQEPTAKDLVDRRDLAGRSAVFSACDRGHLQVLQLLLQAGADAAAADKDARYGLGG
jgi:ankyrin repeat protein